MKVNLILYTTVYPSVILALMVATSFVTNIYAQDEEGNIETEDDIPSELGSELLANTIISSIDNETQTSMLNFSEQGVGEFDNATTPQSDEPLLMGNETFPPEEPLVTGNETLSTDEDLEAGDELMEENETLSTDEDLEAGDELMGDNMTTGMEMVQPTDNASELVEEDGIEVSQAEQSLAPEIDQKIEAAAAATVGITNATGAVENEQITNVQQVINNIAIAGNQGGGDINVIVNQISQVVMNNPNGPAAVAMKKLAEEYSNGNIDEIDIATQQIGIQIAQGKNIEQTLIQISNNVINNINNVKVTIDNYDKIIVHPETLDEDKRTITETITIIKKSKSIVVDVPRVHIKFENDEKNLVLRVLSTDDAKYEMPFSKKKGGFTLDDDEFRVKVMGGKGKVQAGSVAEMQSDGKIGDREFLDKDRRNGKVYFDLDEIESGKYLLEIYIKLSDGSIGTWARGSITIAK